jgi:trigger factor
MEISVPVDEVESETARVIQDLQKRVRLPGFRPGKAPSSLIRKQFDSEVQDRVLKSLVPKYLEREFERDNLRVVGRPDITDVHFHSGEPLRFTAEFEVVPNIELKEYRDLSVPYHDPEVTDADVDQRIEELRDEKAEYVNIDPRPIEHGDHAVVAIQSLAGVAEPVKNDELVLHVGGGDTIEAFTENLTGMSPGDEKDFDITYPEDFGQAKLAGKTVRFHVRVKGLRRKELPELNDEFAQDLGDYRDVGELREALRKSIFAQRQYEAQENAKNLLVEKLVDLHEFPVPEALVDRQVKNRTEQSLRGMQAQGLDISKMKLDWTKLKEAQKDKATREVKASLLLSRVAEREAIVPTVDEVDKEVERIAKQQREPYAAVRLRFEKDGTLGRIADHIQTEKTLAFLFEHARKTTE